MDVDVEHQLVGVRAGIDHRPPARLVESLLLGDLASEREYRRHHLAVAHLVERAHVLPGNDQDMVGAAGLMSGKAMAPSFSPTFFAGICPATILQKMQSSIAHLRRASSNPGAASPGPR